MDTLRTIRKLDLRAPEVIEAEKAANAAWTGYWTGLLYGKNWHPAKMSIVIRKTANVGPTPVAYASYARLSVENHPAISRLTRSDLKYLGILRIVKPSFMDRFRTWVMS